MPFERPTIDELIERAITDVESRLPGASARQPGTNLHTLAMAHAGAMHGLYGALEMYSKELFADTCGLERLYRYADLYGVSPVSGDRASGSVVFSGAAGSVGLAGSVVQLSDAAQYALEANFVIPDGGSVTASVTALTPGAAHNVAAGVKLYLVSPIPGVSSEAVVAAPGIVGGTEDESDERLRERVVEIIRTPRRGGVLADYEAWTREASGSITRVWPVSGEMGAGTVTVRFVLDGADPITPSTDLINTVKAHIEASRPAAGGTLYVAAPILKPVAMTISLGGNDTQAIRDAVTASLQALFDREAAPGATMLISHIRESISIAAGEVDHVLSVPAGNVTSGAGELPQLGAITWS